MSDVLKDILASGRKLLSDTKNPKAQIKPEGGRGKLPNPAAGSTPTNNDPHKTLVKRAIKEKIKKAELVEEVQKMCDAEDAKL